MRYEVQIIFSYYPLTRPFGNGTVGLTVPDDQGGLRRRRDRHHPHSLHPCFCRASFYVLRSDPRELLRGTGKAPRATKAHKHRLDPTRRAQLDHPATQLSREDSESVEVKVWLSYGDGTVVSPYLKHTRGNTGYGTLFDYSAEVEPSEKLTSTIHKLLN